MNESRQAEVRHFGFPFGCDQDIARLDVAMDQTALVRIMEAVGRLPDDVGRVLHRQRSTLRADEPPQVHPRHKLGDQVVHVAVMSRIVSPHEIGMVELCLRANLTREVDDRLRRRLVERQDLDRRFATHHFVNGLEHLPHAALANPVGNDVGTQIEFAASFLELVRLIRCQHIQLDELSRQLVVRYVSRTQAVGAVANGGFDPIQLILGDQPAGQCCGSENGLDCVSHDGTTSGRGALPAAQTSECDGEQPANAKTRRSRVLY